MMRIRGIPWSCMSFLGHFGAVCRLSRSLTVWPELSLGRSGYDRGGWQI